MEIEIIILISIMGGILLDFILYRIWHYWTHASEAKEKETMKWTMEFLMEHVEGLKEHLEKQAEKELLLRRKSWIDYGDEGSE
ncbi:MAG: hypothetical protein ACFFCI_14480 [Promethearchaeota archaeon]